MRLAGIDSIAGANRFLELSFLPQWEERSTVAPRQSHNAHRRLGGEHPLEQILSVREVRKVTQDHTVSWDRNRWGVVEIERRLDGSHWLRFRNRYLCLHHCAAPPPRTVSPSGLRPPGLPVHRVSKKPKRVPPGHPWRTWQKTGHFYFA
jgi:hypothetical protein